MYLKASADVKKISEQLFRNKMTVGDEAVDYEMDLTVIFVRCHCLGKFVKNNKIKTSFFICDMRVAPTDKCKILNFIKRKRRVRTF